MERNQQPGHQHWGFSMHQELFPSSAHAEPICISVRGKSTEKMNLFKPFFGFPHSLRHYFPMFTK